MELTRQEFSVIEMANQRLKRHLNGELGMCEWELRFCGQLKALISVISRRSLIFAAYQLATSKRMNVRVAGELLM